MLDWEGCSGAARRFTLSTIKGADFVEMPRAEIVVAFNPGRPGDFEPDNAPRCL
jgi:hypothetical protein